RIWFLCGLAELQEGKQALAWESWHRSLELGGDFLQPILTESAKHMEGAAILHEILPDNPTLVAQAAIHLYPDEEDPDRLPFQRKALRLLEDSGSALTAEELHLKATLYTALDQPEKAETAYEAALRRKPTYAIWRLELAELLSRQRKYREAQRELV